MNFWMIAFFALWVWAGLGVRHVLLIYATPVGRLPGMWTYIVFWATWPFARKRR